MFITPIERMGKLTSLEDLQKANAQPTSTADGIPFRSFFEDALSGVKEADALVKDESYKLAVGETDDLHNLTIASTKLSLATDLLIAVRNQALEAYNGIMSMGV